MSKSGICLKCTFLVQNRLQTRIELWFALEVAHRMTYIKEFGREYVLYLIRANPLNMACSLLVKEKIGNIFYSKNMT